MPSPHPSPAETFEVAFKFLVALLVLTLLGLLFSGWRQPLLDLTFFGTGLTVLGSAVWWTVRLAQRPIGNARAPRAASALPAAASGGTAVIPRRSVEPVSRQRLRDADWFQFEQVIAAISAAGRQNKIGS